MRKRIHLLPVVLLVCGLGVCLCIYRSIPLKSIILPKNAEQSVVAVVIRRMDECDSKTKEIQDAKTISAAIVCFQNIRVQYQSLTDIIPVAPVLYSIAFISSEQGVCPEVDITSNGSVYIGGVRYRIATGDKAELVSYLENLFS